MGPIGCSETLVTNCQTKMRNISEEFGSHLDLGGSLKPHCGSKYSRKDENDDPFVDGRIIVDR
jgi:hypothetical protein